MWALNSTRRPYAIFVVRLLKHTCQWCIVRSLLYSSKGYFCDVSKYSRDYWVGIFVGPDAVFFFLLFIVLLDNFLFIILFLVFISMFNMCLRVRSWFVNFSYYLVNLFSYLLVWIHLFFLFISFLIATVLCSSTDEYRKKQREYLTNDQVRKKLKTWTLIFKK